MEGKRREHNGDGGVYQVPGRGGEVADRVDLDEGLEPMLVTVAGLRTSRAIAAHSQDRESPHAMSRAMAAITPGRRVYLT